MELRQLAYLDAVVARGGFTRAAEAMHVAQPAISAQIRNLERELGTPLLVRSTRHVSLTHAGELFLARARAVLAELDAARADLADLETVLTGRVRIGAALVVGPLHLPTGLAAFGRRHPGVELSLRTGLVGELCEQLDLGELDLVIGPLGAPDRSGRQTRVLARESVVLVSAPGRAGLTLADVRDEPFVCLPGSSGLRAILDGAARRAGFTPRVQFETRTAAAVRELVSSGLGVALLAASSATGPGAPVAVHELHPAPRHPPISIAHPRGRALTPAARALREHLLTIARA